LKSYCDQVAVQKCGDGDSNKECRSRVSETIRTQETIFRVSTIKSCVCESSAPKYKGLDCDSIVQSCSNDCVVKACKLRSTLECQSNGNQQSCVEETNDRCVTLHTTQE